MKFSLSLRNNLAGRGTETKKMAVGFTMGDKECLSTNGRAEDRSSKDKAAERQDGSNQVIWNVKGVSRSHSFLKGVLSLLSKPAQSLLLLMSVCKGPSVPEEVLQVMYDFKHQKFKQEKADFLEVQKELEASKLVVVHSSPCEWNDRDSKMTRGFWSLSNQHGNSLREEMKEETESVMRVLFGVNFDIDAPMEEVGDNEEVLIRILICLYFSQGRTEKTLAQRLDATARGVAVEPLMWLLPENQRNQLQEPGFKWNDATASRAREVILGFICKGSIEDSHLRHLLMMKFSRRATCWALGLMFADSQTHIHNEKPCDMIKTVVGFLARFRYLHLADNLALVLCLLEQLSSDQKKEQCVVIDNFTPFLKNLRNIVEKTRSSFGNDLIAASITATVLLQWLLTKHDNGERVSTVVESIAVLLQSLVPEEVAALFWNTHGFWGPGTLEEVAAAGHLINTSLKQTMSLDVPQISEAATSLLELLRPFSNGRPSHQLKGELVRALSSLPSDQLGMPLLDHRGALNELVRLFLEDDEAEVREQSAQILWDFAANGLDTFAACREKSPSLRFYDLLDSMGKEPRSKVEHAVAIALLVISNSHSAPDPYIGIFRRRHPSVLNQLMIIPSMVQKGTQERIEKVSSSIGSDATALATCALFCLSKIYPQPLWEGDALTYILMALVSLIDMKASPDLQQLAAESLANLADNSTIRQRVANWRGFVDRVLRGSFDILSQDHQKHYLVQEQTARAIANLCVTRSLADIVECYPGACRILCDLHKWLEFKFALGRHAARALSLIHRRDTSCEGKSYQLRSSKDETDRLLKEAEIPHWLFGSRPMS
ncbi:hypothetical protein R1sor_016482 [Riccia sorocarpa]|uniref:ARM repeat superfamily protein n=1 Tax=Riccia sorocarpa TaxID=122646 RepID=A0ABD3HFK3_9MARC